MPFSIRAMAVADVPAGLRLCRASGWNQTEDDWRFFLQAPGHCLVGEKDGNVVGTVAAIDYGARAWIAMMLVDPRERRTGIGSQLLEASLAMLGEGSCAALDATPLGEPLYRRHGFQSSFALIRMKSLVSSPARLSRNIRPLTADDLPRVRACDREVFGADRSMLLLSLASRAPQYAWVAEEGYCFGRCGYLYDQIGPIVAEDEGTARELVSRCLQPGGRAVIVDAPAHSSEWLSSLGFAEERRLVRMHRGGIAPPPSRHCYGIAGPEFG